MNNSTCYLVIIGLLATSAFSDPCDNFVKRTRENQAFFLAVHPELCIMDISLLKQATSVYQKQFSTEMFGDIKLFTSGNHSFALMVDVKRLSLGNDGMPSISAIPAAVAACFRNPVCKNRLIALGKWAGAATAREALWEGMRKIWGKFF